MGGRRGGERCEQAQRQGRVQAGAVQVGRWAQVVPGCDRGISAGGRYCQYCSGILCRGLGLDVRLRNGGEVGGQGVLSTERHSRQGRKGGEVSGGREVRRDAGGCVAVVVLGLRRVGLVRQEGRGHPRVGTGRGRRRGRAALEVARVQVGHHTSKVEARGGNVKTLVDSKLVVVESVAQLRLVGGEVGERGGVIGQQGGQPAQCKVVGALVAGEAEDSLLKGVGMGEGKEVTSVAGGRGRGARGARAGGRERLGSGAGAGAGERQLTLKGKSADVQPASTARLTVAQRHNGHCGERQWQGTGVCELRLEGRDGSRAERRHGRGGGAALRQQPPGSGSTELCPPKPNATALTV